MAKNTSGLKRWTLEARYKVYVRDYLKKMEVMQKKGLEMSTGMVSMAQYNELYTAMKNDMGGKGNVNRAIIEKQAWGNKSFKAAQAAFSSLKAMTKDELKKFGFTEQDKKEAWIMEHTAYKLRETGQFWNIIKDEYHTQKNKGKSWEQASLYITETFFGGS